METGQLSFVNDPGPAGLAYRPDFVSAEEEAELADRIAGLPLKPFEFHGFEGNRRVASFGWKYVFDGSGLHKTEDIPPFLIPLRDRAAAFAGLAPDRFEHVLLTEYAPGAGIGWHKDRSVFDEVVGISLLASARIRFRRKSGGKWKRANLVAEPRSAYLLTGAVRSEWEHSIPAVDRLRYSITFRSIAQGA